MSKIGKIKEIKGSVVDVEFVETNGHSSLPEIYNALKTGELILEVQSQLNETTVRAVSMGSTDGLARGMEVENTG